MRLAGKVRKIDTNRICAAFSLCLRGALGRVINDIIFLLE
jgi:hypothetical protein